jgi:hypothetical protein
MIQGSKWPKSRLIQFLKINIYSKEDITMIIKIKVVLIFLLFAFNVSCFSISFASGRCTEGEINKMNKSGFSKEQIMKFCGQKSAEKHPISGKWNVKMFFDYKKTYENVGESLHLENSQINLSNNARIEEWEISLQNDNLIVKKSGQALDVKDVDYDDDKLTFSTFTQREGTKQYSLKLINANKIEGRIKEPFDSSSIDPSFDNIFKGYGLDTSKIDGIYYILEMVRISGDQPKKEDEWFPKIN